MARYIILLLIGMGLMGGCQSPSGLVDNIPPPNFSGPVIAPPGTAAPTAAPSWKPVAPLPQAGVSGERAWVPLVRARPWRWIVIHHSATPSGSAATFDRMHRQKGWDEMGYHFVIGNGTDSRNGQVEVGPRWPKQKWGAHAKTADNRYNDYGIGICLVGNFDVQRPTPGQLQSLARLTAHLMQTYRIPPERVLGHRDTKPTDCPGRNLNVAQIRRMANAMLARSGAGTEDMRTAAAGELLRSAP